MRLGIALGGGGARGFAHIGVLEVLSEAGIDFEVVTGTSSGALVGASYASGNLALLKARAAEISLTDIPMLLSPSWSLQGLFSGRNALELLNEVLTVELIEGLPKKFGATACDLRTGEVVEFSSGDLRTALRSSISIPGLFTPILSEGRVLVDGGLAEVLPVELNKKLGSDFVVAVDLYGSMEAPPEHLGKKKELWPKGIKTALTYLSEKIRGGESQRMNLIKVVESTFFVIQKNLTAMRLKICPADLVICPRVSQVGVLDFHRSVPVVEIGRIAAQEMLPELLRKIEERRSS